MFTRVDAFVNFKSGFFSERLPAVIAEKRFVARVPFFVCVQVALRNEALVANFTNVRTFSCMNPYVYFQFGCRTALFSALVADRVRRLSEAQMFFPRVIREMDLRRANLGTNVAQEIVVGVVNGSEMPLHCFFAEESFIARRTWERLNAGMFPFVRLQATGC